jgi:Ca-activated chloride channel family protein
MDLTFTNSAYLWYLAAVPILIVGHFYFLRYAKFRGMKFANFAALKRVADEKLLTKNYTSLALRIVILLCLILAASGATVWYDGAASENDYVVALDVSASMTSEDIEPNRLEAARGIVDGFLDELSASEARSRVGLVSFSGSTSIDQVVTDDIGTVRDALADVSVRQEGGTDIAGAVVTGTNLLVTGDGGRSLIVISDGSATVDNSQAIRRAVSYASGKRVTVNTLGIGSEAGPIGYLPAFYNATSSFNEETLLNLANSTGGTYLDVTNQTMDDALDQLVGETRTATLDIDLRPYLVVVALLLLFLEWGLASTRYRRLP